MPSASVIRNNMLFLLACMFMAATQPAIAALPSNEAPSRGDSGGLLKLMQNYGYDAIVLGGLMLASVAFLVVAGVCINKFHEVHTKKSTWSEFFAFIAVGAMILVIIIWLANKAATIL